MKEPEWLENPMTGESGLSHAAHMACDALFLLHFELEKLASQGER